MTYDPRNVSLSNALHFHRGDYPVTADTTAPQCLKIRTGQLGGMNIFMPDDCPPDLLLAARDALNACFATEEEDAPTAGGPNTEVSDHEEMPF